MNPIIYRKTSDMGDSLRVALVSKSSRRRLDLTDCTATLTASLVSETPVVFTDDATVDPTGLLTYVWQPGQLVLPGVYLCSFRVTFDDGVVETFPRKGFIEVHVETSL